MQRTAATRLQSEAGRLEKPWAFTCELLSQQLALSTFDVVALLLLTPHHPAAPVLSHSTDHIPGSFLPEQLLILEGANPERERDGES